MVRTTSVARTTRLAWMAGMEQMSADFLNCQNHFSNLFASQAIFFGWTFRVQTSANVVHATGSEDRTPQRTQHTRMFFSLRAVLQSVSEFHVSSNAPALAQGMMARVSM